MAPQLKPLAQQVVVVTGASSGIGLTTARMAARRGATVVALARNEPALRSLAGEIRAQGGQALHLACDVGREEEVSRAAEAAVQQFGRIDTWVNNAGIAAIGRLWDIPLAEWRRMFDTTYWGVVHGSLAALRHFRARGGPGAIVNVGSLLGDRAPPLQGAYASAKHAVHGFTDTLRMEIEHARLPVSVSLIHPARVDTPYNEHAGNWLRMQPVHRGMVYPPEAVAEAILWCAAHPRRDIYVGGQAWLGAMAGRLAPRLTDLVMQAFLWDSQVSSRREASGPAAHALHAPGEGGRERGRNEPALLRSGSLFVEASKLMDVPAALGIVGLLAGAALLKAPCGDRRADEGGGGRADRRTGPAGFPGTGARATPARRRTPP